MIEFFSAENKKLNWGTFDKKNSDDTDSVKRIVRSIYRSCKKMFSIDEENIRKIVFDEEPYLLLIGVSSAEGDKELYGFYNSEEFIFYPFINEDKYPFELVKFLFSSKKSNSFDDTINSVRDVYNRELPQRTGSIYQLLKDDIIFDNFLPVNTTRIDFLNDNPHYEKIKKYLIEENYGYTSVGDFYLYSYNFSFSEKFHLLELIYREGENNKLAYFLFDFNWANPFEFEAYFISGSSDVIHNLWAENRGVFDLSTKLKAFDYLRFFCWAIEGEEGHFVLPESISDISWTDAPVLNFDFLGKQKIIKNEETDFEKKLSFSEVNVLYGSSLFEAVFELDPKIGIIEMVDDKPKQDNLPIETHSFNYSKIKVIEKKQEPIDEELPKIELDESYYKDKDEKEKTLEKGKIGDGLDLKKEFKKSETNDAAISNMIFKRTFSIQFHDFKNVCGVVFENCLFEEKVILQDSSLQVEFKNCVFKKGISAADTQFLKTLLFEDCIFFGVIKEYEWKKQHDVCLNFHNFNSKGDLIFNKSVFFGAVNLSNIDLYGNLELVGCSLAKYADNEKVLKIYSSSNLFFKEENILLINSEDSNEDFCKKIRQITDNIDEELLDISNSNINGNLIFKGEKVNDNLVACTSIFGIVKASGITINGNTEIYNFLSVNYVDFQNSFFSQSVNFSKPEWNGFFYETKTIRVRILYGNLDFQNANINGELNISYVKVEGGISLYGVFIDTYLYAFGVACGGDFDLKFSEIRGGFYCYRNNEFSLPDIKPLLIKKDLDFTSAKINIVRLEAIEVEGNIVATTGSFNDFNISYGWGNTQDKEGIYKLAPKRSVVKGYIKLKSIEVKGDLKLSGVLIENNKNKEEDSLKIEASVIGGNLKFFDYKDISSLEELVEGYGNKNYYIIKYIQPEVFDGLKINDKEQLKVLKTEIKDSSQERSKKLNLCLKNLKIGINLDLRNLYVANDVVVNDADIGGDINISGFHKEIIKISGVEKGFNKPTSEEKDYIVHDLETECKKITINRAEVKGSIKASGFKVLEKSESEESEDFGNFTAKSCKISGGLYFIANKEKGIFEGFHEISEKEKEKYIYGKISKLDISLSEVRDLSFAGLNFETKNEVNQKSNFFKRIIRKEEKIERIKLERAVIDKFRIIDPSPENINLSGIKVSSWEFGKSAKADDYIKVFNKMTEFEKSVYLDVEKDLRNKNEDKEANQVYIAMREKNSNVLILMIKKIFLPFVIVIDFFLGIIIAIFTGLFNFFTSYGTRNHNLLLVWLLIWLGSAFLFHNYEIKINGIGYLNESQSILYALQNSVPLIELKFIDGEILEPNTFFKWMAMGFRLLSSIVLTLAVFGLASRASRTK